MDCHTLPRALRLVRNAMMQFVIYMVRFLFWMSMANWTKSKIQVVYTNIIYCYCRRTVGTVPRERTEGRKEECKNGQYRNLLINIVLKHALFQTCNVSTKINTHWKLFLLVFLSVFLAQSNFSEECNWKVKSHCWINRTNERARTW